MRPVKRPLQKESGLTGGIEFGIKKIKSREGNSLKRIHVAAAIIVDNSEKDKKIFATQRGYGDWKDYWEFPGGKIEEKETPEEAIIREIEEELDTLIRPVEKLTTIEYDYPEFHLSMECFICEVVKGELKLLEAEDSRWLTKADLRSIGWLPADETILKQIEERIFDVEEDLQGL